MVLDILPGAKTKYFGSGSGPVLLSDVICDGTEDSLLDCAHHVCSLTHCSRTNDVGIICESKCIICMKRICLFIFLNQK